MQRRVFLIFLVLLTSILLFSTGCGVQPIEVVGEDKVPTEVIPSFPDGQPTTPEPEPEPEPESEPEQEPEPIFPEKITVLNASEITPINVKAEPSLDSKNVGVVYGNLVSVDIIEHLDNGFSKIATQDYKSNFKPIEGFVPTEKLKEIKLNEKYGVLVSLGEQRIYIYEGDEIIKTFVCSTGLDEENYPTPEGIFRIGDRGESFYTPKLKSGAYNWVRFNYNYLFHGPPFDVNREIIEEEVAKLGQKASHGCIRLTTEDSIWFYNNIPRGTPVVIRD